MNNKRKELYLELSRLLVDPNEKWRVDAYTITHANSGVCLWIANGVLSVDTRPGVGFRLREKFSLWRKVKIAIANIELAKLTPKQLPHDRKEKQPRVRKSP